MSHPEGRGSKYFLTKKEPDILLYAGFWIKGQYAFSFDHTNYIQKYLTKIRRIMFDQYNIDNTGIVKIK